MRNLTVQGEWKRIIHDSSAAASDATVNLDENDADSRSLETSSSCSPRRRCVVDVCPAHDTDDAVFVLSNDGFIAMVDTKETVLWKTNLSSICEDKMGEWFSLTNVDSCVVAFNRNGSIVSIQDGVAELVGEFENGIAAAAWSPDRSLLVLITSTVEDDANYGNSDTTDESSKQAKKSVLLSMNAEWDVLSEETIETISLHTVDTAGTVTDQPVAICWSTSNAFFAVNSVDQADGLRKIRIYQRDTLTVHAIGRTQDASGKLAPNLLPCTSMAWAGEACSHLLAAVQKKGKAAQQIAFFEPNGLCHGEFLLRPEESGSGTTDERVVSLSWNRESDLLAVILQGNQSYKVQMWHRSNYHWYMKYERRFPIRDAVDAKFHSDDPYLLFIMLSDLRWIELKLQWASSTVAPYEATAFVVDGSCLNVTALERATVPPPMYACTLNLPSPVCEITFSKTDRPAAARSSKYGIAMMSNDTFAIVNFGISKEAIARQPCIVSVIGCTLMNGFGVSSLRNLTIVREEEAPALHLELVAIGSSWEKPGQDCLVALSFSESTATVTGSFPLEDTCLAVTSWSDDSDGALVQLCDGTFLEYDCGCVDTETDDGHLTPSPMEPLLEPCPWISAVRNASNIAANTHSPRLVVGMSLRNRFYCNDYQVADAISSFSLSIRNHYLCFATSGSRCVLRFVSLHDAATFDPLSGSDDHHVLDGYEPRNVERGSRLVAVLSDKAAAILQMPRGNIEIIHPRALVLRHGMIKTNDKLYKEAFELMRRHKVDMNLIIDMNPNHFLAEGGANRFIEQIHSIDHLNLFISCLQNGNVTQERYVIPQWIQNSINAVDVHEFDYSTKLNRTCRALRSVMMEMELKGQSADGRSINEGHFLLPILSTFAKEDPPHIETALRLVQENAIRKHAIVSKKPALFSEAAQSSIQYLAFLADYELLFETSLGLYDFDMARAVARNSQMDPKSYLPLLQRYRSLPTFYGRFQVDLKLKRFESALKNLFKSGVEGEVIPEGDDSASIGNDFASCLQLIEQRQLHRPGLQLFSEKSHRNRILLSLGDHLMTTKQVSVALCIFLTVDPTDEERCIRAAVESNDWATAFSMPSVRMDKLRQQTLARKVAEDLAASSVGHFKRCDILRDAARVLLDYGSDVPGAVEMLTRAEEWSEGLRLAEMHARDDLARKVTDSAVLFAHTTISDISERGEAYLLASARYDLVLEIRKGAILSDGLAAMVELDQDDNGSLLSAVSNASNLSMRSHTSVGSVGSLSSVISVRSTNSFSLTGEENAYRHKSKFNQLGRQKTKKTKKSKGSKVRPGSEEELQGLVQTLRGSCPDDAFCRTVSATILFLIQHGQLYVAKSLYDSYVDLCSKVENARQGRSANDPKWGASVHKAANVNNSVSRVEAVVDGLLGADLPTTIHSVFSYVPAW